MIRINTILSQQISTQEFNLPTIHPLNSSRYSGIDIAENFEAGGPVALILASLHTDLVWDTPQLLDLMGAFSYVIWRSPPGTGSLGLYRSGCLRGHPSRSDAPMQAQVQRHGLQWPDAVPLTGLWLATRVVRRWR